MPSKPDPAAGGPQPRHYLSVGSMAVMTAAAIFTSLRGLPTLAQEELTMFAYIAFSVLLFLIPSALVAAELGSAFADRKGGVYDWVGEAFGRHWGFVAIWLQWIENVVWYPTALAFGAVAVAFTLDDRDLATDNVFIGLFCIVAYWIATLIALSGTALLVKVTKYGFVLGTILPGLVLVGLFGFWVLKGRELGWDTATDPAIAVDVDGHVNPRWLPHIDGLGALSFLATILLLFTGVEVQAVHVIGMRDPRREFPVAIGLAAVIAVAMLTVGALAVAGILPYNQISLTSGVFDALDQGLEEIGSPSWILPILAALICYGALGGALAWIHGPARGLLVCARDGMLPPFLQRTNAKHIEVNILLVQGAIVTVISGLYLVMDNVSTAFFLISAMTVGLYIVMYLFMYAAAIKLRYSQPDLPRSFMIPGGTLGLWLTAGVGFVAVAIALVLSFVPPDQLPVGDPVTYVALVGSGTLVFTVLPLVIYQLRRPSWKQSGPDPGPDGDPSSAPAPA